MATKLYCRNPECRWSGPIEEGQQRKGTFGGTEIICPDCKGDNIKAVEITEAERAKDEAKRALRDGIKSGDVKIEITHKCSWCGKIFKTTEEWEAHRIEGKTRRICPNKCQEFGQVTAEETRRAK